MSTQHSKNAKKFLKNGTYAKWHDATFWAVRTKRDNMAQGLDEWEQLRDKVERHIQTGAEYVTGPDCSCLMHMAGVARKQGLKIEFKHVVEILAAGL